MKFSQVEKKQLLIYVLIAYGITFAMGILMWYGYTHEMDNSAFPNAQMMYPAAGVMMAYLAMRKKDSRFKTEPPRGFYYCFLLITAVMIVLAVLSVIRPDEMTIVSGTMITVWMMVLQFVMIGGSIVLWITLMIAGKEKRRAYGLNGNKWKVSLLCILLFIALYFLRTAVSCAVGGQMQQFFEIWQNPLTWISLINLPINFFLVAAPFFGEEYGWRYYLQPLLQKRFGVRRGVVLLGVVWGLWHMPVDFFYYTTPDMGLAACVSQQITCITLGIFMAYVYMKTENIWIVTAIHFLNNNLIAVIAGNYSSDILQNQTITWGALVPALIVNVLIFGLFIFAKPFREKKAAGIASDAALL